MSKNNLFKSMFALLFAFAAVAFVGCKDDIEDVQAPVLTVSPAILNFDELGGSETVELSANCDWSIGETPSWVDIQPMSGSGNTTLTVTTYPKNENQKHVVYFTLYHSEYGEWGKSKSTLTINQTYGGEPIVEDIFYYNDFDKEAATKTYGSGESWPYLDQFEGWKNQTGTGVENVTYSFKGMSARNNSNSDGSYSDYAGSGVNNMFFGSGAYLQIENIAITSTNVNLSFGGEKYLNGSDNLFMPEEFKITLSADGQNWSAPITYTQPEGAGRWNLGGADFTLPEGTTTLWIKFEASVASAYRIDDVKLMGGFGGQQITFDGGSVTPPTPGGEIPEGAVEVTVQEFLDAAEDDTIYVLTGEISRVVKEDWGNFDLTDETATVYIYGLLSPEGEEKVQFQAAGLKQGDTITLYGKRSSYNGEAQMADATYVSHTSGGGEQPGPGGDLVPGEGPYASDSPFVCTADSFSNPAGLGDTTIDGNAATGFKLGTGKLTGVYSATAGVAGDKYLNFYAVAWKGKTATLYVRVDGVQVGEFALTANDGATSNPPFNALTPAATDHYSVELKGLTASSKVEFSTSPNYAAESNEASGRAIVFGVKLTDEAVVPGGGDEPAPTPGEVVKGTVQEFLTAADTATTYELTGEITSVDNTIYGNFDLTDETGTVYIYGLLSPEGEAQKQWAAAGLKQGDTITIQGVYSEYNGEPQIKNAVYVSHTPGEGGGDEPEDPVTPSEGDYASDAAFVCTGDSYSNPSGLGDTTIGGQVATGFKLGTGKMTGVFASQAVGVSGDKYLNFYAVAWKSKTATLYVRVDGTQVGEFTLAANDGATSNPPFNALAPATTDHYSVKLTGLTASSVVEFSTSANYAAEDNNDSGRAIVFGVKLTDEALAPEQGGNENPGGGDEPAPTPTPGGVVKATVQEFLNAAEDDTIYELTGEITSVTNTTYGNFYLKDSTAEVLIYGLCSPSGEQKYWAASGVKVGDTITVQTVRSSYQGTPQGKDAIYVSHTPGEGGGDEPEDPVTPSEGDYASDAAFVCTGDSYSNPSGLGDTTIGGQAATGFKLGTGKMTGLFTSAAVGVSGDKTLSFYAVAWKSKTATLYVRVDGKQVAALDLNANDGATGNPPYTALAPTSSDYYTVALTGLTASSVVEFSTSANYIVESNSASGRAIVCGVKLN